MVYTGKPSAGCESCRKSKKKCDQGVPVCGRCARLGKPCGGYRDVSDLLFRDESDIVSRRVSAIGEGAGSGPGSSTARLPSPDKETMARNFFFQHFITANHFSSLQGINPDAFLTKAILACAYAVIANRNGGDVATRELARRHYGSSIAATNIALRHPRRCKEDNTLIAVSLLGFFECLVWDRDQSMQSWNHHIQGTSMLLQIRGRHQIRSKSGAALFRDFRGSIITNALRCEQAVPEFIVQWSQALEYDPKFSPADQLVVLTSRLATVRQLFRTAEMSDEELTDICAVLEQDLLAWSESTLAQGSMGSFHNVRDADSRHTWNGTRHEYGIPQAHRHWNMWRSLRILLSRVQEALWRRSWPTLAQPSRPIVRTEHYRDIRERMTADICIALAYAFGDDNSVEPPQGSVSSGYLLTGPILLAATHLLEELSDVVTTPGGNRMILVSEPRHTDPFNQSSVQLSWIIDRVDYIAHKVGLSWAQSLSFFLRGEKNFFYDLGRWQVSSQSVEAV